MRNGLQKYLLVLLTVGLCALTALGQGASTGSLSGTVLDPKGSRENNSWMPRPCAVEVHARR